jgi:hypothetical protein
MIDASGPAAPARVRAHTRGGVPKETQPTGALRPP